MSDNGQTWLIILNKVGSVLRLVTLRLANQARGLVTQTRNVNTARIHAPSKIEMTQSPYIRTLLQVDDNLQNTDLITQLIARRSDLKLLTATSGHQGIEMACSYLPDVILMDIKMPGMDGHEAFQRLRKNPSTARIPVIALSSNAYKVEIKQCLDAGFFCYITKPYRIAELMAMIDAALNCAEENRPTT